jgi:two-component system response regulator HydG
VEGSTFLVVDDDPLVLEQVTWSLERAGHRVFRADDVASALDLLAHHSVDAVLLDMYLPDGKGLDVLARAIELEPRPPVLMMTGRAEVRSAVEAMRLGASDFMEKPLDLEDLHIRLERALGRGVMNRRLAALEARERERLGKPRFASPALKKVFELATRVATTPASSSLLLGESGVGKEVIATYIHEKSDRREGPFVRVNLAAIPESMVEAELFGSVRGAFTDAKRDRAGHFASAAGGTILLDEIGDSRPDLQSKLLRALEERRFFPVGSDRERRLDARIIAATNREPKDLIAQGRLREDLYYRIATLVIRIPPLRERRADILPLAEHFCAVYAAEFGRPNLRFEAATKEALLAYHWPGNVRELRNVVERAAMLTDSGEIGLDVLDLPVESKKPGQVAPDLEKEDATLVAVERDHIVRVLERVGGSRTRAAKLLGISRSTLWEKLKRLGLA